MKQDISKPINTNQKAPIKVNQTDQKLSKFYQVEYIKHLRMSEQKEKRGSFEFIISIKLECFTTSKTDPHLLLQKVLKKISVIKANTFDGMYLLKEY